MAPASCALADRRRIHRPRRRRLPHGPSRRRVAFFPDRRGSVGSARRVRDYRGRAALGGLDRLVLRGTAARPRRGSSGRSAACGRGRRRGASDASCRGGCEPSPPPTRGGATRMACDPDRRVGRARSTCAAVHRSPQSAGDTSGTGRSIRTRRRVAICPRRLGAERCSRHAHCGVCRCGSCRSGRDHRRRLGEAHDRDDRGRHHLYGDSRVADRGSAAAAKPCRPPSPWGKPSPPPATVGSGSHPNPGCRDAQKASTV